MNGNIKGFIGFLLGAIAGGVAAYIYQDKRLSKKFEEELKAYTEPKVEADTADGEDANNDTATDESKGDDDDMKKTNIPQDALDAAKKMQEGARKAKEDRERRGEREKSKTNYSKLTRGYASSGKDESEGDDKDMTMSEKIIKNQPYYISKEEFMEMDMKDGYRGVDLFYNADTDTVCNDDGEELDSAWESIGWSTIQDMYDGKWNGGDELYVRNDNFKEVYCIMKNFML